MTKYEWERELKRNIQRLPQDEVKTVLDYYNELFEDKSERGMSEKEIINEFGNPFDVAVRILTEYEGENFANGAAQNGGNTSQNVKSSSGTGTNEQSSGKNSGGIYGFFENVGDKLNTVFSDIKRQFTRTDKSERSAGAETPSSRDENSDTIYYESSGNNGGAAMQYTDTATTAKPKTVRHKDFSSFKIFFIFPMIIFIIVSMSVSLSLTVSGAACLVAGPFYAVTSLFSLSTLGTANFLINFAMSLSGFGIGCLLLWVGIKLTVIFLKLTKLYFFGKKENDNNGGQR